MIIYIYTHISIVRISGKLECDKISIHCDVIRVKRDWTFPTGIRKRCMFMDFFLQKCFWGHFLMLRLAPNIPDLDSWVSKLEWTRLHALSPACKGFLRFASGATPVDLLTYKKTSDVLTQWRRMDGWKWRGVSESVGVGVKVVGGWDEWVIGGGSNHVIIALFGKATVLNNKRNKKTEEESFIRDEQTTRKKSSPGNFSESCATQICSGFPGLYS